MPSRLNHTIFNERPESQEKAISLLKNMGYEYVSRSEAEKKRKTLAKVVFEDELAKYLCKQTYNFNKQEYPFSAESIAKAVNAIDAPLLQGLMMASKEIYNMIIKGISLEQNIPVDGETPFKQSFDLNYIDFENPENNTWQVTEEFSVERSNGEYARPDIVLMINGLPMVVIECKKSSTDASEGVQQQCRNMQPEYIQQLFKFTQIVMALNPNKALYGTAGTEKKYFSEWKEENEENTNAITQDKIIMSMLSKERLLDLIKNFILYDANIKKICRYQQYFAVNKTIDRINGKDETDSKNGVIWHTQGSGKSIIMIMLAKKLKSIKHLENPRFLIVTDRINLDKQIQENFIHTNMDSVRAHKTNMLKSLLEDKGKSIITTLVNKFSNLARSGFVCKDSVNFYVLVDEAHRSQYSSMYNYMLEVMPSATFIAFTGTPLIAKKDRNTYKNFGKPIHNYTMKRALEDKVIVPLVYEGRKVRLNEPKKTIDAYFESLTNGLLPEQKKELKEKFSKYKKLAATNSRLSLLAFDIHDHFINYCKPFGLKAMIVCSSRAAAVDMHDILTSSFDDICPKVVITFDDKNEGDDDDTSDAAIKKINNYHKKAIWAKFGNNNEKYESSVCNRFKNFEDEIDILIVKDKLLTGFDAPIAGVLYLDKSLKEHSLLQAIARVNRIYPGKDVGLIVDYYGIFSKLNAAVEMYDDAESGLNQFDKGDLDNAIFGPVDEKNKLKNLHEKLLEIFEALPNKNRADSNAWQIYLKNDEKRKEFYQALKEFAITLNLSLTNRTIFVEVGLKQIEKYRNDYLFFRKLKDAIMLRYNDNSADLSKYENGISNLLNTFITSEEVNVIMKPVSINDKRAMNKMLDEMKTNDARADAIRTRVESKLKQVRYDDPLLFEEFSEKIRKTLAEYELQRNDDKYLTEIKQISDDFNTGLSKHDYPDSIKNDSDTKAFYGVIYTNLEKIAKLENKLLISAVAKEIKFVIENNTKRDWKNNLTVHKQIRNDLDNHLFDLFENLGLDVNKEEIVEVIDLIIDKIMKTAIVRF
jgi:type I restriction enzyme R subunit